MRALLSTIGSRGDVQPLVALALELRALGAEVRLCVPPDFREWIEGLGFPVTPIGPELRRMAMAVPNPPPVPPSPERLREMAEATVATQFETIAAAAQGCDFIVGATALQVAAPSVAERMGVPYAFAAYCPAVLPSPRHAPPPLPLPGAVPAPEKADYAEVWAEDAVRWNQTWGAVLNAHRASMGLAPVEDVRSYIFTGHPWLAADPTLAPWPGPAEPAVFQPGAWILPDDRPLSPAVEAFLDSGEPPVYFGFGSTRAPGDLGRCMVEAARAVGRRAIVSQGWAGFSVPDDDPGCLAVGEVNLRALFPRVAAVVHHGGAGTTTLAAIAGVPQVVIPQVYDQHYWAQRVRQLGIGVAHAPGTPTVETMTRALEHALQGEVAGRAQCLAPQVRPDGALAAARRLISGAVRGGD